MNRSIKHPSRGAKQTFYTPIEAAWAPRLNLAEEEFRVPLAEIEERSVHHCDRPEIEVRILDFISRAHGPNINGIAAEMGISVAAAEVHVRELQRVRRIWGQPMHGGEMAWHIAQEGTHFLAERGRQAHAEL
jgi:hypothetical protein